MSLGSLRASCAEVSRDQKPGGISPVGVQVRRKGDREPWDFLQVGWGRARLGEGRYCLDRAELGAPSSLLPVEVISVVQGSVPGD